MYKIGDRIKFKIGDMIYIGTVIEGSEAICNVKDMMFFHNDKLHKCFMSYSSIPTKNIISKIQNKEGEDNE